MLKAQGAKSVVVLANVLPFTKEMRDVPRARAEEGRHRDQALHRVPARREGHDRDPHAGQAGQRGRGAGAGLPGRFGAVRRAGQGARTELAVPVRRHRPSDAFFPKAVGAASADGVVTIAHWSPRADWKGGPGLLRFVRQEVRRGPGLPELGAGLDVAGDPGRRRGEEPPEARRFARLCPPTRSTPSTARSSSKACRARSRRPPSCSTRRASCRSCGLPPSPRAVPGEEGLVTFRLKTGSSSSSPALGPAPVRGARHGSLYALVALGLEPCLRPMRMLDVAHGDVVMLGAYGGFWAFTLAGVSPLVAAPWSRWPAPRWAWRCTAACSAACWRG